MTLDEVSYVDGLTSGFWSTCDEWGMRVGWRLGMKDETRTMRDDQRSNRSFYRLGKSTISLHDERPTYMYMY